MNFFNTKADKDLNKKYMRDYKNAIDFNRYMYMYNLFIENQKLHAKLNQQSNQTSTPQPPLFIPPPVFMTRQAPVFMPPQTPVFMPPQAPVFMPPQTPVFMPPQTPVFMPPQTPVFMPPQPQLFINPALNMYQPYLFNYNSQVSTAIKTINNISDSIDATIHDVICLVQNSNNDIIIVRDISTGEWVLPAGIINISSAETPFATTQRIFTENTTFLIDQQSITFPIKYYDIKHSNNTITRLFKINTTQTFGNYTPTATTDRLEYISILHIKLCLIQFKYFNIQNIHTFTKLFHIGLI